MILSKGIGIDLGTTNSTVAVMDPSDTEVVLYRDDITRSPLTSSCVWRDPATGETVVGRKAFQRTGTDPGPISSIKRQMGREITVDLSCEARTPAQISAAILEELVSQISGVIQTWNTDEAAWVVQRGVVTIPAYFRQPAVEATREAAHLAGLELIELLHEPTAAATYYCWAQDLSDGVFMVYDLGGGTFDVSILRRTAGEFDVLGISGDNFLGGDDFDALLARHMMDVLKEDGHRLDLDLESSAEDGLIFAQLRMLADGVKKQLSEQHEVLVQDSMIADQDGQRMIIDMVIERPTFEDLIREKIDGTMDVCHKAIDIAREQGDISLSDVDEILLVGSSTWIPLVKDTVKRDLCRRSQDDTERAQCYEPSRKDPDTCVAMGAAVRAAIHGLDAWDDERTGRVHFRGQASTPNDAARITGEVEVLGEEADLAGGSIEVTIGDFVEEAELSDTGSFRFTDMPLERDGVTRLNFAVFDAEDQCLFTIGRDMVQSDDARRLGGGDNPLRLPEPLLLEVERQGRIERKVLLEAMSALPASARHKFSHPGNTNMLRLTLYQGAVKIKDVLVATPPTLPEGTPISLNVQMDAEYLIAVDGEIGEIPFSALVQPPPPPDPPTEADIDRFCSEFENAWQYMRAAQGVQAKVKFSQLIEDMGQAMADNDEARAIARMQELEACMLEWIQKPLVLDPPWNDFDKLRHQTLRVIVQAEQEGVERFDAAATRRWVDDLTALARGAYDNSDQVLYGQAYDDLHERARFVHGLLEPADTGPANPVQEAMSYHSQLVSMLETVRELAALRDVHTHDEQLDELEDELNQLQAMIATEPEEVVQRGRNVHQDLEAIRAQLRQEMGGPDAVPVPKE